MRDACCASTNLSPRLVSADTPPDPCCWPPGWGACPMSSSSRTPSRASRTGCWREFLHELPRAMKFLHGSGEKRRSLRVAPCARSSSASHRGGRESRFGCSSPAAARERCRSTGYLSMPWTASPPEKMNWRSCTRPANAIIMLYAPLMRGAKSTRRLSPSSRTWRNALPGQM